MLGQQLNVSAIDVMRGTGIVQKAARRLVRIMVSDPDPHVPMDMVILHHDPEKFTDETEQEIILQLGVPVMLSAHNAKRASAGLKAIRLRDLSINVHHLVWL